MSLHTVTWAGIIAQRYVKRRFQHSVRPEKVLGQTKWDVSASEQHSLRGSRDFVSLHLPKEICCHLRLLDVCPINHCRRAVSRSRFSCRTLHNRASARAGQRQQPQPQLPRVERSSRPGLQSSSQPGTHRNPGKPSTAGQVRSCCQRLTVQGIVPVQ